VPVDFIEWRSEEFLVQRKIGTCEVTNFLDFFYYLNSKLLISVRKFKKIKL